VTDLSDIYRCVSSDSQAQILFLVFVSLRIAGFVTDLSDIYRCVSSDSQAQILFLVFVSLRIAGFLTVLFACQPDVQWSS